MNRFAPLLALDVRLVCGRPLFRAACFAAAAAGALAAFLAEGAAFLKLARAATVLVPLVASFGALLGAGSLSGDLASGALRAVLLRPVSRGAAALSRAASLLFAQAFVVVAGAAGAYCVARVQGEFGPVVYGTGEEAVELLSAAETAAAALRAGALALPGLFAAPLLGLAVGAWIDDPAAAALAALALILGPALLGPVTTAAAAVSPVAAGAEAAAIFAELAEGVQTRQERLAAAEFALAAWRTPGGVAVAATLAAVWRLVRRDVV
jgi:hypothetical protein